MSTGYTKRYPRIREALSERYRHLPSVHIERIVEQTFGTSAEQVEDIWDTLATVAQVALPALGTVVGGPLGGVVGGAAGQLAAGAISQATQPKRHVPRPVSPAPPPAAAPRPPAPPPPPKVVQSGAMRAEPLSAQAPAPGAQTAPASAGNQAVSQLFSIVLSPGVLQALLSAALGAFGRESVEFDGTSVRVGAIPNLIGYAADQAAAEHYRRVGPAGEAVPEYLVDESGEYKCDVTSPEERAEVLWEKIQTSNAKYLGEGNDERDNWMEWQMMMQDRILDEIQLTEALNEDED
jgi:hypothetical protein